MHFLLFLTGQIWRHQEGCQGCGWRTHEGHPGIHRAPGMRLSLLPDLRTVCRSVFSLTSLSLFCRSSPQTSTVTAAPPSLMLVLASPSTTTLSSWSHGTPLSWMGFKSKYLLWQTRTDSFLLFLNQVRQWVRLQQPCLRPDGPHGHQGVNQASWSAVTTHKSPDTRVIRVQ